MYVNDFRTHELEKKAALKTTKSPTSSIAQVKFLKYIKEIHKLSFLKK